MKKKIWLMLVTMCILSVCMGACSSKNAEKIPEHAHWDVGYLPFLDGFEDAEIKYAKISGSEKNGELVIM